MVDAYALVGGLFAALIYPITGLLTAYNQIIIPVACADGEVKKVPRSVFTIV